MLILLGIGQVRGQGSVLSIEGAAAFDQVGRVLLQLPDVTGDGIPDIATGSPLRAGTPGPLTGVVEIRSGADGSLFTSFEGTQIGERFGSALALADVDGDDTLDLVIGSPLFSGTPGAASGRFRVLDIGSGTVLLEVEGAAAGDRFGASVIGLPDQNGDDAHEVAAGAPFRDGGPGTNIGEVTIHSGATGTVLGTFSGEAASDRLGETMVRLGDTDNDFVVDFAVSAPFHDGPAGTDAGRVYVLSAQASFITTLDGGIAGGQFGLSLAAPGDIDGDSREDIVVGAPQSSAAAGIGAGRIEAWSLSPVTLEWGLEGGQAGELLGSALSAVGDPDGDIINAIAVGSRLYDGVAGLDTGRVQVLSADLGTLQYAREGTTAGGQLGFAVGGGGDIDDAGRPDTLVAAPFRTTAGGVQAGEILALSLDGPVGQTVRSYEIGPLPERLLPIDAEGDGDLDLAVICTGDATLRILWNTAHDAAPTTAGQGVFDVIPPTVISLDAASEPVSLTGGDWDGDGIAEFAIGRRDGTIERVDGSGTLAAPVFAAVPGLIVVDARQAAGRISGLAVVQTTPTPILVAALEGTAALVGEVRTVTDPLGAPVVGPPLLAGGTFSGVEVLDLDDSGDVDIVATNSSTGPSGGVHVLLGPTFANAAPGAPYAVGGVAVRSAGGSLDGNGLNDDLLVSSYSFGGGGVSVLQDFNAVGGFPSPTALAGPALSRAAAVGRYEETGSAAAVVDGLGNLFLSTGWTGSGFSQTAPLPVGSDIVDVHIEQLTAFDGFTVCNREELVALLRRDGKVRVVRNGTPGTVVPVPNTGCPAGASVAQIVISGTPVIGDFLFGINLIGASPSAPATLVIQASTAPGTLPLVILDSGCGFQVFSLDFLFIDTVTTPSGTAGIPIPLPPINSLACIEVSLQWAVIDGGPLGGGLTVSDGVVLRLGEF